MKTRDCWVLEAYEKAGRKTRLITLGVRPHWVQIIRDFEREAKNRCPFDLSISRQEVFPLRLELRTARK